jgi:hypothetical protein
MCPSVCKPSLEVPPVACFLGPSISKWEGHGVEKQIHNTTYILNLTTLFSHLKSEEE